MTTDTAQVDAAQTDTRADPPAPTLTDALSWDADERGDLPSELQTASIDDIRKLVTERSDAAATEREQAVLERVRADAARTRLSGAQAAEAQTDITYYQDIRTRLASDDDTVVTAARDEMLANEERYNTGAAALVATSKQAQHQEMLKDFFGAMHSELEAAGLTGVIPAVGDPAWLTLTEKLAAYDGKGGIAAYLIDHGKGLATAEAAESAERSQRIDANATDGGPQFNEGGPVRQGDYTDPTWVKTRMDNDPEWAHETSPDGKLTNIQRVRRETVPAMQRS